MKVNLLGRTRLEQEAVEVEIEAKGSLWPRFSILHQYAFTKAELAKVELAKERLAMFRKKLRAISGSDLSPCQ